MMKYICFSQPYFLDYKCYFDFYFFCFVYWFSNTYWTLFTIDVVSILNFQQLIKVRLVLFNGL